MILTRRSRQRMRIRLSVLVWTPFVVAECLLALWIFSSAPPRTVTVTLDASRDSWVAPLALEWDCHPPELFCRRGFIFATGGRR